MGGHAHPREAAAGRLLENLAHFGRLLRACGLPIGSGHLVSAAEAVRAIGIESREDFYWTLHAVFVDRVADRDIFDRAFRAFWNSPGLLLPLGGVTRPNGGAGTPPDSDLGRRLADALSAGRPTMEVSPPGTGKADLDAVLTWSSREVLRSKDFEKMSKEEIAKAKAAVAALRPHLPLVSTRRLRAHPRGRQIDMRATLRAALRAGRGGIPLVYARRRERPAHIVVICDVSGSMSRYSSLLLHFAHALATAQGESSRVRVRYAADQHHAPTFGSRIRTWPSKRFPGGRGLERKYADWPLPA